MVHFKHNLLMHIVIYIFNDSLSAFHFLNPQILEDSLDWFNIVLCRKEAAKKEVGSISVVICLDL